MSDRPASGSLWFLPVSSGALLILVGVILFIWPHLLAFIVASCFVIAGLSLISTASRRHGNIVYRRIDDAWRNQG